MGTRWIWTTEGKQRRRRHICRQQNKKQKVILKKEQSGVKPGQDTIFTMRKNKNSLPIENGVKEFPLYKCECEGTGSYSYRRRGGCELGGQRLRKTEKAIPVGATYATDAFYYDGFRNDNNLDFVCVSVQELIGFRGRSGRIKGGGPSNSWGKDWDGGN